MSERSTLLNAVIGAAATVVLTVLPFSPVLGGAVAGYLERGDYREGATVGALSGVIAAIPMALFATVLLTLFTIVPTAGGRMGVGLFFGFMFLVVGLFFLLYTVGLSALGGVLGVVLADEFGGDSRTDGHFGESEYAEPPVQTVEDEGSERQDEF